MSLQTRATAAAGGLRAATPVDVEVGLARIRPTHRRRRAARVAVAAAVVAGAVAVGAPVLDGTDRTAPPVDQGPVQNLDPSPGHKIVHAVEPGPAKTRYSDVLSLPDAGAAAFPAWRAFDQDTGRFLFTQAVIIEGEPDLDGESFRTMRVLAPGLNAAVATIHCVEQCNLVHSFGPGQDEVTTLVSPGMRWRPRMAQVWGFDGVLRDEIDLSGVQKGREHRRPGVVPRRQPAGRQHLPGRGGARLSRRSTTGTVCGRYPRTRAAFISSTEPEEIRGRSIGRARCPSWNCRRS